MKAGPITPVKHYAQINFKSFAVFIKNRLAKNHWLCYNQFALGEFRADYT